MFGVSRSCMLISSVEKRRYSCECCRNNSLYSALYNPARLTRGGGAYEPDGYDVKL